MELLCDSVQGDRVGGKDHHNTIQVEPNCIELNASDLSGGGLEECVAGEQAEVLLTPRDALGNANASFNISSEAGSQTLQVRPPALWLRPCHTPVPPLSIVAVVFARDECRCSWAFLVPGRRRRCRASVSFCMPRHYPSPGRGAHKAAPVSFCACLAGSAASFDYHRSRAVVIQLRVWQRRTELHARPDPCPSYTALLSKPLLMCPEQLPRCCLSDSCTRPWLHVCFLPHL